MTQASFQEKRYSVCIAYAASPDEVKFYRVADYYPDEAEPGNELIPAPSLMSFDDPEGRYANPDYIFCREAYYGYPRRDSDVYMLEWAPDKDEPWKQVAHICKDAEGMFGCDSIREVIAIPEVNCREDLVELLQRGFDLKRKTTREFYVVYEHAADKNLRRAIKCKRSDFVSQDGRLRLLQDPMNVQQSVLSAPIVELPEEKIIQSDFKDLKGREIYSGLWDLAQTKGALLLRPINYYANDYVKHFLDHCKTVSWLTDKERRYAVAWAINEALSYPHEIAVYLGAQCPVDELTQLKAAICRQMKDLEDDAVQLVQSALMDDDAIRDKLTLLARAQSDELLASERAGLLAIEAQRTEAEKGRDSYKKEAANLETKVTGLKREVADAETRIAELADAEQKAVQELENNVALKIGLSAIAKARVGGETARDSSGTLFVTTMCHIPCSKSDDDLLAVLEKNLDELGVTVTTGVSPENLHTAAVGAVGTVSTGMPLAIPEPIATPMAIALAAARFASAPTRIAVPADFRDIAAVVNAASEPGVYLVDGVIDSANEGILFAMQHQWEQSIVIFPFKSYASALLLAREAWNGMFMPNVEALSWAEFFSNPKALATVANIEGVKAPKRRDVVDRANSLANDLSELALAHSSLVLPAAIAVVAEDMGDEDYEPVIAQHLAVATGATAESLQALEEWVVQATGDSWGHELRQRVGMANG